MTTLTREDANQMVVNLNNKPSVHPGNSASFFSNSISWHPRWHIIFNIIKNVENEYNVLFPMLDDIRDAIKNGEVTQIEDWGGGWSWKANIVKVNGKKIRVINGGVCLYKGQHDRPVVRL